MPESDAKEALQAGWTEIGPNPIPNAQVQTGASTPASGRTVAIAIHPTDPNIVYAGTAQGGLYRTTDGGTTWTPMLDNALSLAVGAVAIAPSQPDTIYVGTGEAGFSADSFFGVGIYRIDNASTANPVVTGPLNKDAAGGDVFTGRSIGRIIVDPTNPDTIFATSTSGVGGIISAANSVLPNRGLFRSTNATSANPTFTKLGVVSVGENISIVEAGSDPTNVNNLVLSYVDTLGGLGGVYTTNDALAATPTFTRTLALTGTSSSSLRTEFASQRSAGASAATFYAASGDTTTGSNGGKLFRSTDGGMTWTLQIANSFCGGQCFYDIAVAVDPTNPDRVYLGGTTSITAAISTNGGTSFTVSQSGLHTDSHVFAVAPSDPTNVWFGSDGGIYKSINSGAAWTSASNTTYRATQFMSVAVHPTDPNFTIGGTQDNGTNLYRANGTWFRNDAGDGGYAVIDQDATDTTTVRMYHTYYNATNQQLYAYRNTPETGSWASRGCTGTATKNGITCSASTAILFYAPLEQGPTVPGGLGNTIYYGTDRLYRSIDTGINNATVSQAPIETGVPISAVGISPQNDNVRIVGLRSGGIWGTTTGSSTLTNLDPTDNVPNNAIARAVIDPQNVNTAYVTLSAFGVVNIWKSTNINAASPTWTAVAGSGANAVPQVPVNAFLVDPLDPNRLYAGTDIGVYTTGDGGATWTPFGTGLPRVAVFDMAFTSGRLLRIATHGRGMWEIPAIAPSYEADVQSRPNGDGSIDDSDIQQIRRFSVGLDQPYQGSEFQRADCSPRNTSGDGDVDDGDIQQVRRYAVGLDTKQNAAGPTTPSPIAPPVSSKASSGAIKGAATVRTKDGVQAAPAAFRVDNQNTSAGTTLMVPIRVDTVGNEAGYTFSIAFDSTKLTNPSVAIGNGGGDVVFNANNPGQIGFSVTSFSGGTIAAANNVALVNVTFTAAAGAPAGTTPITFTDTPARRKASGVDPNNPITQPTYTNGTITIGGATAAGATISGRVLSSTGRGVANAQVIVTNRSGEIVRTARTNGFGYYNAAEIPSGESYIVRVESKQYKFASRVVTIAQDIDGIDFTAQQP